MKKNLLTLVVFVIFSAPSFAEGTYRQNDNPYDRETYRQNDNPYDR